MTQPNTVIVIFGGTGDLARRKLVPALFQLACKGRLPERFHILGAARPEMTDDQYRDLMWQSLQEFSDLAVREEEWSHFARALHYTDVDLTSEEGYNRHKWQLTKFEEDWQTPNCLFYLSIAPQLFDPVIRGLAESGLAAEEESWRRVVIEKPFGRDLDSSIDLNLEVPEVFSEDRVYRIDHYLGKETVQNLLVFRFANAIFESLWSRDHIDNIQITVAETVSVADRAGYYDRSGVIRDMVQNHLLQLQALVAMDPPAVLDAESLRNKKIEVLKAVRRWTPKDAAENAVLGQYRGYQGEEGVRNGSSMPMYAALRVFVDNWRWNGVPFYLRTGKSMTDKLTEIVVQFKCPPHILFSQEEGRGLNPNVLSMCPQPDEGMHLRIDVKVPDQGLQLEPNDMAFHYGSGFGEQANPEAYERLLQDALEGDASLFIRADHIEEAWRTVVPLIAYSDASPTAALRLYRPGTWGPDESEDLLAQDGFGWQSLCAAHGDAVG